MDVYPLVFEPILKEKVWGGRRLASIGKRLPPGSKIGESWELADLSSTDPSGGGGDAAHSIIANGPLAGRTIRDAIGVWGRDLLGAARLTEEGGFPLLVKFLDAAENLSVQVHPSPAYASAHPRAHVKTESWFVLDAAPGALVYRGVRRGVTPELFRRHIAEGTVAGDLVATPARAGDFFHLPSGTVHALGAGVMVAEIQTPSDTTFRVFDWDRAGRALHVAQAMECIDFSGRGGGRAHNAEGLGRASLVETEFYSINRVELRPGGRIAAATRGRPAVLLCFAGAGVVRCDGCEETTLGAGTTSLAPARVGTYELEASAAGLRLLEVAV